MDTPERLTRWAEAHREGLDTEEGGPGSEPPSSFRRRTPPSGAIAPQWAGSGPGSTWGAAARLRAR